jgi:hypothetical protein
MAELCVVVVLVVGDILAVQCAAQVDAAQRDPGHLIHDLFGGMF